MIFLNHTALNWFLMSAGKQMLSRDPFCNTLVRYVGSEGIYSASKVCAMVVKLPPTVKGNLWCCSVAVARRVKIKSL